VNITDKYDTFSRKTRLSVYGDLRINDTIPTDPVAALKFIQELPKHTQNSLENNGTGVPMEITLTPLVWLDSTAAQLNRKIENDLLQKLINIYGALEKSSSHIMDVHSMRYNGYTSWKHSIDIFTKHLIFMQSNYHRIFTQLRLSIFLAMETSVVLSISKRTTGVQVIYST